MQDADIVSDSVSISSELEANNSEDEHQEKEQEHLPSTKPKERARKTLLTP